MYGKKKKDLLALAALDELHQELSYILSRNSERDRPRNFVRNGIIDSTKTNSFERLVNFYSLLCLSCTAHGRELLAHALGSHDAIDDFRECIKLYLGMEAWFHGVNEKEEVKNAREMVANVLTLFCKVFPRTDGRTEMEGV